MVFAIRNYLYVNVHSTCYQIHSRRESKNIVKIQKNVNWYSFTEFDRFHAFSLSLSRVHIQPWNWWMEARIVRWISISKSWCPTILVKFENGDKPSNLFISFKDDACQKARRLAATEKELDCGWVHYHFLLSGLCLDVYGYHSLSRNKVSGRLPRHHSNEWNRSQSIGVCSCTSNLRIARKC